MNLSEGCIYRGVKLAGQKPKKVKDEDGDIYYMYRGHYISQNEDVPRGYWGRWTASWGKISDDTLTNVCLKIDKFKVNK